MSSKINHLQATHLDFKKKSFQKEIVLICADVKGPANLGGLFRLADAFGVKEILSTLPLDSTSNRFKRTARNTDNHVPYRVIEDLTTTMSILKDEGYTILALEITASSIALQNKEYDANKYALVVGSETHGIHASLLEGVSGCIHIDMFGTNSSMNVVQATAIALYEIRRDE